MFCPECGKSLKEGARFCDQCGTKMDLADLNPGVVSDGNEIESLVERAKSGDESAFQALYDKTSKRNYYVALKMAKTEADAQDVLQDAYIRIYQHLDQFTYNGESSFASWTSKIVSNTALNLLRKKQMIFFSDIEGDQEGEITLEIEDEDESRQPELAYDKKETSRIVQELLGNLSDEQRVCAMMYYYQEQSVKEIASEIGCSENTVKSRLNYARRNMLGKAEELKKKGILTGILSMAGLFAILRSKEAMAMVRVPAIVYPAVSETIGAGSIATYSAVSNGSVAGGTASGAAVSGGTATAGASSSVASVGVAASTGLGLKIAIGSIVGAAVLAIGTVAVINLPKSENGSQPASEVEATMVPAPTPAPVTGSAIDGEEEMNTPTPKPTETPDYEKAYDRYFKHRKGVITVPGENYYNQGNHGLQQIDQISLDLKAFKKKELVDIDNDGIPEMIMGSQSFYFEEFETYEEYEEEGEDFNPGSVLICGYIDGKVTPVFGVNGLRGSVFKATNNRFCAFFGGSGEGQYVFYKKDGDEIKYDLDYLFEGMNHTEEQWPHHWYVTNKKGRQKEISSDEYDDYIEENIEYEFFK